MLDRLPGTLQGRVHLGAGHVAALVALVAAALGVSAWWAVRAADPGELVVSRTAAAPDGASPLVAASVPPGAGAAAAAPAASPSTGGMGPTTDGPAAQVVVDVAGKVRRPGIARLPAGARVVDALEAAGGPRRGVRLSTVNLARLLVDGEQILVGLPAVPGVAASAAAAPGGGAVAGAGSAPPPLVNLNTADQAELETLPGVGPVRAQAILQWRAEHGAFGAVEEMLDISGIGEATLAELAPLVTL